MSDHTVTLTDGGSMPLLGFGTWQIHGREAYDAVRVALDVGYRHIDTATLYRNEAEIGRALRDSGVARGGRLPHDEAASQRRRARGPGPQSQPRRLGHRLSRSVAGSLATPRPCLVADGAVARTPRTPVPPASALHAQIDELVDATGVTPAVNQIRWSPEALRPPSSRPVAGPRRGAGGVQPVRTSNLRDSVLVGIASAHGVTAAQVVLRWHIDHGFVVIPKSVRRERIAANFDVFGFSPTAELARIDALGHP